MSFHRKLQDEIDEGSVKAFSLGKQNSEYSERHNVKSNPTTTIIPILTPADQKRHPNDKSAPGITLSRRRSGSYYTHHEAKSSRHSTPRVTRTAHIQPSRGEPSRRPIPRAGNRPRAEAVEAAEEQAQEQEPENRAQGYVLSNQSDEPEPQLQPVQDFHSSFSSSSSDCVSLLCDALAALDTNHMSTFDEMVEEAKFLQQADIEGSEYFYIFEVARDRIRSRKVEDAEKAKSMIAKQLGILDKRSHVEYYQPDGIA